MTEKDFVCISCGCEQLKVASENRLICTSCGVVHEFTETGNLSIVEGICPECGYTNDCGNRFCGKCGYSLFRTCPECDTQFQWFIAFCPGCGANYRKSMTHLKKIQAERAAAGKELSDIQTEEERRIEEKLRVEEEVAQKMDRWAVTKRKFTRRIVILMLPAFLLLFSAIGLYLQFYLPSLMRAVVEWSFLVSLVLFLPCTIYAITKTRRLLTGEKILKRRFSAFRRNRPKE